MDHHRPPQVPRGPPGFPQVPIRRTKLKKLLHLDPGPTAELKKAPLDSAALAPLQLHSNLGRLAMLSHDLPTLVFCIMQH